MMWGIVILSILISFLKSIRIKHHQNIGSVDKYYYYDDDVCKGWYRYETI